MENFFNQILLHSGELALLALFLIVLAESTALVGLLIPGTVLMVAVGTLIGQGQLDFWQACAAGFVAAALGDGLSYWLGHRYRRPLQRHRWIRPHRGLLLQARQVLRRHGPAGIVAGRFFGPSRPVLPMVAGMLAMPQRRFFPACLFACLFWTPAYLLPGILAGAAVGLAPHDGMSFSTLLLLACGLLALAGWLLTRAVRDGLLRGNVLALPAALRWSTPLACAAGAIALWHTLQHPLAPAYGARLLEVML
ncbi:DedA family protein [Chitinilyticum aquatile]|uniref:DedA family protein n=1 Tax=Chitinilyticum aquatile TaxID=362520 RepID=UPI00041B61D8|nr:DedA family protein [Chitinilyticum aquatile]